MPTSTAHPSRSTCSRVSLDDIPSEYPQLSLSTLATIPDDQIIVFWAEHARFTVSPPVAGTGEPRDPWSHIWDPTGETVGFSRCYEDTETSRGTHEREFILIGTDTSSTGTEKAVLGIEEQTDGMKGVWSRQSAGRIGEEEWRQARPVTNLVLLG